MMMCVDAWLSRCFYKNRKKERRIRRRKKNFVGNDFHCDERSDDEKENNNKKFSYMHARVLIKSQAMCVVCRWLVGFKLNDRGSEEIK